jgi:hypothetical protein
MIWKDSILYDFEVKVKQSNVAKDAGLGAFLRFRGARVLEGEQRKINNAKMSARTPVDPGTLEKLEARYQDGSGVAQLHLLAIIFMVTTTLFGEQRRNVR